MTPSTGRSLKHIQSYSFCFVFCDTELRHPVTPLSVVMRVILKHDSPDFQDLTVTLVRLFATAYPSNFKYSTRISVILST